MAEYGPIGVALLGACELVRIPLVVHFHGYDAYVDRVLEEHREGYRLLFDRAAAIIAVSQDMVHQLIRLGASADRVMHVSYGVDSTLFAEGCAKRTWSSLSRGRSLRREEGPPPYAAGFREGDSCLPAGAPENDW